MKKSKKKENKKENKKGKSSDSYVFYKDLNLIEDAVIGLIFFSVTLLFSTGLLVNFTLPKLVALRVCTICLVLFWVYRIKKGEIKPVPKLIFYTGVILGLWWIFTTFFALHKPTAIHGVYGRYNGLLTHEIWLLIFFVIVSMPMDIKRIERILKLFIASLIPVSLYALVQFYGYDPVPWVQLQGRSASTIGHPVMLSALLGLALPFVITFFFQEKTAMERFSWGIIFLLFLLAAITTLSRGPLIGIVVSSTLVIVFNLKNIKLPKKQYILFFSSLIMVLVIVLSIYGDRGRVVDRIKSSDEIKIRLIYYKATMNIVRDNPLVGVGMENFRIIYPRYRLAEENEIARDIVPTMVHNGYLQTALTNGVLALLLYLTFLISIIALLIKTYMNQKDQHRKLLLIGFLASISGFLIQDLTGWLEISLTTFFWIILGLAVSLCTMESQKVVMTGAKRTVGYVLSLSCFFILIYLSGESINRVYTDRLFWKSKMLYASSAWKEIESNILEGLKIMENDFYYEDMAGTLYARRFGETGEEALYRKSASLFEKAHIHNEFDSYVLLHRIELETLALRKGTITKPSQYGEYAVDKLPVMDKNNPSVYEALTRLRMAEKRVPEALDLMNRAKVLSYEHRKFYLLEGDVYRELKDYPGAIGSYEKSISLSEKEKLLKKENQLKPEWITAKYGLVFCLIQTKDYTRGLKEIKSVLSLFPDNVGSYIIMGDVYGFMNDIEKAKESFATVLKIDPGNPFAKRGHLKCIEILEKRQYR
jgi:tetratricopeptide (TPR) repeat protein/O-antigen ligase